MTSGRLLEDGFRHAPESLFHRPEFYHLHADQESVFFEWLVDEKVVASIHFGPIGDGLWRSPARGTYAGYWTTPAISVDELLAFHAAVETRLKVLGATSLEILPVPEAHSQSRFAIQCYALLSSGFRIGQCDLNYTARMDGPLSERMSYGNRKRLKKCANEGLIAERLPLQDIDAVYAVIAANREGKGYPLSMTLEQVREMAVAFPEDLLLFGMTSAGELIAGAICLRVDQDVLYVFYWGDRPGYSALSPVVTLAAAIADCCRAMGISLLDVGTSTVGAEPNAGLIHFKRGLGFEESLKLRLIKSLT